MVYDIWFKPPLETDWLMPMGCGNIPWRTSFGPIYSPQLKFGLENVNDNIEEIHLARSEKCTFGILEIEIRFVEKYLCKTIEKINKKLPFLNKRVDICEEFVVVVN